LRAIGELPGDGYGMNLGAALGGYDGARLEIHLQPEYE